MHAASLKYVIKERMQMFLQRLGGHAFGWKYLGGRHMENIHAMAEAPTRTAPHSAASRVSVAIGKITHDSQPTK